MSFFLIFRPSHGLGCYLSVAVVLIFSSCGFYSTPEYERQLSIIQRVNRVVVFLQRWPVYLQLPGQAGAGDCFLKPDAIFAAPWESAPRLNLRALDVQDIDDNLMGEILVRALEKKGYQAFLAELPFPSAEKCTVQAVMDRYLALGPGVDAFLFCYYSPTLFLTRARAAPEDFRRRPYSLSEIVGFLTPSTQWTVWAGQVSGQAPANAITHAFIYVTMSLLTAREGKPLLMVADTQSAGKLHPFVPQCPPAPTDEDYPADEAIIQRLMVNNLKCRLHHIIP